MFETYKKYLGKFGVGVTSKEQLKVNSKKTKFPKFSEYLKSKRGDKNG